MMQSLSWAWILGLKLPQHSEKGDAMNINLLTKLPFLEIQ